MKGRLIANGILSIVITIGLIVLIYSSTTLLFDAIDYSSVLESDNGIQGYYQTNPETPHFIAIAIASAFLLAIPLNVSFVMGIVTLATQKHESVQGLTIASGILAILGVVFFVNAIISFIALFKIIKFEKQENKTQETITK